MSLGTMIGLHFGCKASLNHLPLHLHPYQACASRITMPSLVQHHTGRVATQQAAFSSGSAPKPCLAGRSRVCTRSRARVVSVLANSSQHKLALLSPSKVLPARWGNPGACWLQWLLNCALTHTFDAGQPVPEGGEAQGGRVP